MLETRVLCIISQSYNAIIQRKPSIKNFLRMKFYKQSSSFPPNQKKTKKQTLVLISFSCGKTAEDIAVKNSKCKWMMMLTFFIRVNVEQV